MSDEVDNTQFYDAIAGFAKIAKARADRIKDENGEITGDFYCRVYEAPKYKDKGKARYGAEHDSMRFSGSDNAAIVIDNLCFAVSSIVKEGGTFRIWIDAVRDKTVLHDVNFWVTVSAEKQAEIEDESPAKNPYEYEVKLLREMNRELRVERDRLMERAIDQNDHIVEQSLKVSKMVFQDRDNAMALFGAMKAMEGQESNGRDPVKDAMLIKIIDRVDAIIGNVAQWATHNAPGGKIPEQNSGTNDVETLTRIIDTMISGGTYSFTELNIMVAKIKEFVSFASKNQISAKEG